MKIITDDQHYINIANAIRFKQGIEDPLAMLLYPADMADAITSIGTKSDVVLDRLLITPNGEDLVEHAEAGTGWNEVVVAGDENLIPENIKKGVTIYGVTGTLET